MRILDISRVQKENWIIHYNIDEVYIQWFILILDGMFLSDTGTNTLMLNGQILHQQYFSLFFHIFL